MPYYFYEDWTDGHIVKIHLANCRYCNHGTGIMRQELRSNAPNAGRWHGPFDTCQQVENAARDTDGDVSPCGECHPCPQQR